MSLIKFNKRMPWISSELSDFFDKKDLFRDDFWDMATIREPALNIKENEDHVEIDLAAPGLSKDDFKVTIDDGYLNISAEKEDSREEKKNHFTRKEFNYNSFKRSMLLPDTVKEDSIKASYEDGILHLKMAKKEEAKVHSSRVVEIH